MLTRKYEDYEFVKTYWNGEPVKIVEGKAIVVDDLRFSQYWAKPFVGQIRKCIMIDFGKDSFFIDNEDGMGMVKVTMGKGMWNYPHRSLTIQPGSFIKNDQI